MGLTVWLGTMSRRLLEHLLDGALELAVMAREIVLGGIIDLDVGQQLLVFAVVASHVTTAHLRTAEDESPVNKRLPPHGGGDIYVAMLERWLMSPEKNVI